MGEVLPWICRVHKESRQYGHPGIIVAKVEKAEVVVYGNGDAYIEMKVGGRAQQMVLPHPWGLPVVGEMLRETEKPTPRAPWPTGQQFHDQRMGNMNLFLPDGWRIYVNNEAFTRYPLHTWFNEKGHSHG
jgi:hypothetical protein